MPHYQVTRRITAPPETVWAALTDASRLQDGSFGILEIEGAIRAGETIRLRSEADPKRAFAIYVAETEPARRMVWSSGMPLGLFRGTRVFTLRPDPGGTLFTMREDYSGLLAGLMFRVIPDLQASFDTFAAALAAATEDTA